MEIVQRIDLLRRAGHPLHVIAAILDLDPADIAAVLADPSLVADETAGEGLAAVYQVFEVTDLLIPSGTDWSSTGHLLGNLVVPSWASQIRFKLWLEVDVHGPLILDVSSSLDYGTSSTYTSTSLQGSDLWATSPDESGPFDLVADYIASQFLTSTDPTSAPPTVVIGLHTGTPTAEDITVVRARAVSW